MVGLSRKRVFPKTKGDSITGQDRAQKHCDFRFSQIIKSQFCNYPLYKPHLKMSQTLLINICIVLFLMLKLILQNLKQGLFLTNFIAVIGLYSQCQKVSFFPNLLRKIPNFKSEKNLNKNHHFIMVKVGLNLLNIQHCTVSYNTSCNGDYK